MPSEVTGSRKLAASLVLGAVLLVQNKADAFAHGSDLVEIDGKHGHHQAENGGKADAGTEKTWFFACGYIHRDKACLIDCLHC